MPGTPILPPIISEEHAAIERAAAARAAGIEGYHPDLASAKAASVDGVGAVDEQDEPIADIWTFGSDQDMRSFVIPATCTSHRDAKLFKRLEAALPTLILEPLKQLKHPMAW
jgi:hypothetical protein